MNEGHGKPYHCGFLQRDDLADPLLEKQFEGVQVVVVLLGFVYSFKNDDDAAHVRAGPNHVAMFVESACYLYPR